MILEALADAPDGELVRVESRDEQVVITKEGRSLRVRVTGATGYKVFRATGGGNAAVIATLTGAGSVAFDDEVANAVSITVFVRRKNSSGEMCDNNATDAEYTPNMCSASPG